MLSSADALYGAAYQVLHERVMPDTCTTRERLAEIVASLAVVTSWASGQPTDVRIAYHRAFVDIYKRAETVVNNNERVNQMRAARETLPLPPA
jgi:hypothetical protein